MANPTINHLNRDFRYCPAEEMVLVIERWIDQDMIAVAPNDGVEWSAAFSSSLTYLAAVVRDWRMNHLKLTQARMGHGISKWDYTRWITPLSRATVHRIESGQRPPLPGEVIQWAGRVAQPHHQHNTKNRTLHDILEQTLRELPSGT